MRVLAMSRDVAPAKIAPPPAGARPFWPVMIPVYNRIAYLGAAPESVLKQDPDAVAQQREAVYTKAIGAPWWRSVYAVVKRQLTQG